jgi:hypothetical protein
MSDKSDPGKPGALAGRRDVLALGLGLLASSRVAAKAPAPMPPNQSHLGAHGFDFLLGRWTVKHRRLAARLQGSSDWVEFPGTLEVASILGGAGDIDQNVLEVPTGRYHATSLRIFDRQTQLWSVYWIDGRDATVANPVVGRFEGRVGHFYNDDDLGGRPIRVRFIYEDLGPRSARWSQAFSPDAGKSWEVNWTMEFTRIGKRSA